MGLQTRLTRALFKMNICDIFHMNCIISYFGSTATRTPTSTILLTGWLILIFGFWNWLGRFSIFYDLLTIIDVLLMNWFSLVLQIYVNLFCIYFLGSGTAYTLLSFKRVATSKDHIPAWHWFHLKTFFDGLRWLSVESLLYYWFRFFNIIIDGISSIPKFEWCTFHSLIIYF
jgi:hypothetical protein